jgi:sRNA-binding protein
MTTNRTMSMVARLQARWPRAFTTDPPKPLALGTTDAILAQLREPHNAHRTTQAVRAAMEFWTTQPEYLRACVAGARHQGL